MVATRQPVVSDTLVRVYTYCLSDMAEAVVFLIDSLKEAIADISPY